MAKFPPLPETDLAEIHNPNTRENAISETGVAYWGSNWREVRKLYTATQLRARDLEIWRMAMEEAASHCIKVGIRAFSPMQDDGARECAAAIRSLPEPSPSTDQADVSKSGAGIDMAATQDSGSGASI